MNLEPYISQILESYGKGVYYEEIRRAKEYYFSRAIKVAEGSDRFRGSRPCRRDPTLAARAGTSEGSGEAGILGRVGAQVESSQATDRRPSGDWRRAY